MLNESTTSNSVKCPYCGNDAVWCDNKVIYGRSVGKSHMIWVCIPCDARVSCHMNTRVPMGTLANAELRKLRMKAHENIDRPWRSGRIRRVVMYGLLEDHFGFVVHVGESDEEMCKRLIKLDIEKIVKRYFRKSQLVRHKRVERKFTNKQRRG